MTCLHWTIYLWKGLYLIGCPLLLRTNYRCVPSLNISVDDAKCVENVHKFIKYTHFCPYLSWLNKQSFNSLGCPLMLRTNYRCVQSLNISVDVSKCVENVHTLIHYTHFWTVTKTTCLRWTIYSWQTFNSLGCPLMIQTNYRCVQSVNISVDVAKCVENVHKFTQITHFLSVTKNDLSWLNNLFMASLQLNRMSTYVKNKPQMCSVKQHQCRWRQICGKCSQIHQVHSHFLRTCPDWTIYSWQSFNSLWCPFLLRTNYRCVQSLNISVDVAKCVVNVHKFTQFTHFLSVTKNDLSWLNNLFMERFLHNRMSTYVKNKLQMCSVTQHQCRRRQMCGKCSHINSLHSLLDCYKKDLSSLNNLFMAKFQLFSMSFYAKNKLQMCSVTQNQCRRRQMCRKCSHIHQVHSLFVRTCPDWSIYSWRTFNSLGCPLSLRTNYRCVQSLNISVDVAKCVESVQTLIHYTHFWTVTKKDLSSPNNLFMAKFQLIRMSSSAKNKLEMCSVTQHQWRRRQMCG